MMMCGKEAKYRVVTDGVEARIGQRLVLFKEHGEYGGFHSVDCIAAEQAMNAYVAQWTNYCQHCQGAGVLTWQENQAPLGSGHTWLETLSEPCDNCVGAGRCPRCGGAAPASWDDGGEEPCPHCGWNWCKVAGDCKPDAECYCYEWTDEGEFRDAKAQWYADQPDGAQRLEEFERRRQAHAEAVYSRWRQRLGLKEGDV